MRRLFVILATLSVLPLAAQNEGAAQQLRKLMQVYRYLDGLYVDEVEMGPLVESAIEGMLEELDPHSAYIGAEEMKGVQESFEGEFSGIGVEFNVLRDTVIVVNTIAGGPAERVGVRANDRIVRIDTLDAVGMSRTDVPKHLRGKTGTKVGIDVVRHGTPGRLHFVIVRDKIPLNTVDASYLAGEGIGYIKVNRFGRTTMDEFTEAYRKLGRPEGLILDLRGNGGGLLEQAEELLRPLGVGRWAIVCDDTVAGLYGAPLARRTGWPLVTFPAGEGSKSLEEYDRLCRRLVQLGLTRSDGIVALGGGVTGDLAGFAADRIAREGYVSDRRADGADGIA